MESVESYNYTSCKGIKYFIFMKECSYIDFFPKPGHACSCHLVNTHNAVTYEAFDKGLDLFH